ncbi:hypothetical protein Hanom_Chr12g01068721 [Helianthus anomalus]
MYVIDFLISFGYSLINALDPKAAGAMVEAIQEDGKSTCRYANVALGEDDEDNLVDPLREEIVVLSSGSFDKPLEGLTSHCARAGTAQGGADEPIQEVVGGDVETPVAPSSQVETRRKTKAEKPEKGEKRFEGERTGTFRERPSALPFLDYVAVSATLSGLGAGEKPRGSDPENRATLSEHMRKKALEDKKRKLDEQAAALLASKKAKLRKEAHPASSESEIDMGIFSKQRGNLLEEIFVASAPTEVKSVKKPRKLDISQITPPASPPSSTVGLTPPRDDPEKKKKEDEIVADDVDEGGGDAAGAGGVDDRGKRIETEVESSEATLPQTIYTKRPSSSGGATSGAVRSPQFTNVGADSGDTHNPTCDDLSHAPRWNLTQGSRMNDLANCHDFFSMSLPPAERMFQKRRDRFELLDDHVRARVNFFASAQEIVRDWKSMGEETAEFEDAKRALAEDREKFNAEKKGLQWRVVDAEQKLEEQKRINLQKQKDWETACECTSLADEAHQARLASERKEKEYVDRIDKLELLVKQKASECEATAKLLEEKTLECSASNGLVEKISADCRWLLSRVVPLLADRIVNSPELATYMYELGQAGYNRGWKYGYY